MSFDALVLLGCRVGAGSLPPAAARRAARAAAGFHARLAPRVVVTGGRVWDGRTEADRLADELVRNGVPRECVLLERASLTTRANAVLTARLLMPLGFRYVGLVSCDWHLARALWNFRHEGFEAEPVAAESPPVSVRRFVTRAVRERGSFFFDWVRAAG